MICLCGHNASSHGMTEDSVDGCTATEVARSCLCPGFKIKLDLPLRFFVEQRDTLASITRTLNYMADKLFEKPQCPMCNGVGNLGGGSLGERVCQCSDPNVYMEW